MSRSLRGSLVTLLTWVLVLAFFFPVFWMILNGFKPESVASSVNPRVLFTPSTEGYQLAMDRGMQGYLMNSLTASVTATIIAVVLAIPAAYALSIRRVKNVEGALSFQFADGCTLEYVAPAVVEVPSGHDAWVVGEGPAVLVEVDFETATVDRLGLPARHEH